MLRFFGKKTDTTTLLQNSGPSTVAYGSVFDVPRYPSAKDGFPPVSVEQIYLSQNELIEKIRTAMQFTVVEFNRLCVPVIEQFIRWCHLLPASEAHHHRAPGGMFRHSLEVSYMSICKTSRHVFGRDNPMLKMHENFGVNRRFVYISFVAGLLHDIGKATRDISVKLKPDNPYVSTQPAMVWNPYECSLVDFIEKHGGNRNYLASFRRDRNHNEHQLFSMYVAHEIIVPEARLFLTIDGTTNVLMETLLIVISGTKFFPKESETALVANIISLSDLESCQRDLRGDVGIPPTERDSIPLFEHIAKKIYYLWSSGEITLNNVNSRLFFTNNRLFIDFKESLHRLLIDSLIKDGIGVPSDQKEMVRILSEGGVITQESSSRRYEIHVETEAQVGLTFYCYEVNSDFYSDLIDQHLADSSVTVSLVEHNDVANDKVAENTKKIKEDQHLISSSGQKSQPNESMPKNKPKSDIAVKPKIISEALVNDLFDDGIVVSPPSKSLKSAHKSTAVKSSAPTVPSSPSLIDTDDNSNGVKASEAPGGFNKTEMDSLLGLFEGIGAHDTKVEKDPVTKNGTGKVTINDDGIKDKSKKKSKTSASINSTNSDISGVDSHVVLPTNKLIDRIVGAIKGKAIPNYLSVELENGMFRLSGDTIKLFKWLESETNVSRHNIRRQISLVLDCDFTEDGLVINIPVTSMEGV